MTLKPCPAGSPKNGFGTCSMQRRAERQVRGSQLVDVDDAVVRSAQAEVAAGRARVLEADGHVARQLAVDVDRVLLHPRRSLVLIDELDLPPTPASAPSALPTGCSMPFGNGLLSATFGRNWPWIDERLLAEADLPVVGVARRLVVPRRPVDAVAGAQHRPRVERVHDAKPRRDLERPADRPGSSRRRSRRHTRGRRRSRCPVIGLTTFPSAPPGLSVRSKATVKLSFSSIEPGLVLEPHTEVHRGLRADAEVVLRVPAVVVHERVERVRDADAARFPGSPDGSPSRKLPRSAFPDGVVPPVPLARVRTT